MHTTVVTIIIKVELLYPAFQSQYVRVLPALTDIYELQQNMTYNLIHPTIITQKHFKRHLSRIAVN